MDLAFLHKVSCNSFLPSHYYRMTFDIAVQPSFSMGAAILFHSNGNILRAWTRRFKTTDPFMGEAEAAHLALSRAADLKLLSLLF
ncbi:hypothetical protein CJ030_MR4G014259 [Morella rubra]|uniref:RNase H type-1 domain-containing protein n=1 Tax=Morella rubra TaxID=262757 RepID=A0A6A1VVR1_9ROSI|nr:hypothetical protein CJ030_MR4G014259 [Morella rubra]